MDEGKKGNSLYDLLMRLGGLDRVHLEVEVNRLSKKLGVDPENMSMSDLRRVALVYLEEMNDEICGQQSSVKPIPLRSRLQRPGLLIEEEELAEA